MADPFEEFEFKPLTEGLGFHKKADKLKSDIRSTMASTEQLSPRSATRPNEAFSNSDFDTSRSAAQSISDLMASLPPSLDFLDEKQDLTRPVAATPAASRTQIFQPLAREDYKSPVVSGPATTGDLPAPGSKAGGLFSTAAAGSMSSPMTMAAGTMAAPSAYGTRMAEGFAKAFPADTARKQKPAFAANSEGLTPVAAGLSAGLIDAMVVAGIATILLVCIITITHINLVAMLSNASTDSATQLNLVFLFFAVLQMYMLVSRAFFGASLGEWAFELQMGTNVQHRKLAYPAMVLWRSLVVTFTGVLILPLLSFGLGRDLTRYLTGLQLYRHP